MGFIIGFGVSNRINEVSWAKEFWKDGMHESTNPRIHDFMNARIHELVLLGLELLREAIGLALHCTEL